MHPGIDELIALHRADARASARDEAAIDHAVRLRAEWAAAGTLCPPPLLTGHDLLEMGIEQGPAFKGLLVKAREAQLDGTLRTREEALGFVRMLLVQ
jgi:poly(A) polymerase